ALKYCIYADNRIFYTKFGYINKSFDNYDLGFIINLKKIKTIDDLLTNNLVLKKAYCDTF
ncbi:TPA: hypothetical protein ACHGMX_002735, partial [Enterococcus faecium]